MFSKHLTAIHIFSANHTGNYCLTMYMCSLILIGGIFLKSLGVAGWSADGLSSAFSPPDSTVMEQVQLSRCFVW
ncbi:hypothetical protein F7725_002011 [Dissostichus mawsoni]|uniref:Uncharacterized protein n=1 Tax=Dissostichus mawsoni TaxID=36200 RepID=A0A7J5Y171_DISMA|nr:hypothetical protein F7725_002011 [Dissostichus mawsoni]